MAEVNINAGEIASIRLNEQASDVDTPAAGYWSIYVKANGLYAINEAGSVSGLFVPGICQGRLTIETGVAISTADQTAKTTVYFTPYKGNLIGLYNGADGWDILAFSELSLSLSGYTADKNYDIWVYNNSGTAALDSTIWTNDTTRATALAVQDGIYVKTGATTRRYVGTIRITGTTGQCEDSVANRFVWNYYNRIDRRLYKTDGTGHDYTTNAFRAWNNDATQIVKFVAGVIEDTNSVSMTCVVDGDDTNTSYFGIGYNVTNAVIADTATGGVTTTQLSRINTSAYHLPTSVGLGYYSALEYGATGGHFSYYWLESLIKT